MDFTFLTEEQIWGDDALDVMKRYGTKVAPTDLTVILGGWVTGRDHRTSEGDLTCGSWSASSIGYEYVRCVDSRGDEGWYNPQWRGFSARPALHASEVAKISPINVRNIAGICVAEYGEYPQTVANKDISVILEKSYLNGLIHKTGKNYTFDSYGFAVYNTSFNAVPFSEYKIGGRRYIRIPGQPADSDSKLSNGEQVTAGKPYWVEVQPIEWLMDKSGTMVAKKCLFAGIQFDKKISYDGDFSKTFMKHYLDTYFAKEMEPAEREISREDSKNLENSDMIALKMSAEEKKARLNSASKVLQSVKIKDITD